MILTELFVILALIVANGVFAGAEIAIVSLRHTRLQQLVDSAPGRSPTCAPSPSASSRRCRSASRS
jgi:CBS domain containing-hemolysin-like protein